MRAADIVVIGEGEETFIDLLAEANLHAIRGIAFRQGDAIIRTADRLRSAILMRCQTSVGTDRHGVLFTAIRKG